MQQFIEQKSRAKRETKIVNVRGRQRRMMNRAVGLGLEASIYGVQRRAEVQGRRQTTECRNRQEFGAGSEYRSPGYRLRSVVRLQTIKGKR